MQKKFFFKMWLAPIRLNLGHFFKNLVGMFIFGFFEMVLFLWVVVSDFVRFEMIWFHLVSFCR